MGIPAIQQATIGAYVMKQLLKRNRRYPLVLMLEPLFRCNLRCKGCGKIAQPEETLRRQLSVEECVAAAEECGAPVVSIPGGEPLLHPDIVRIVAELTRRKKFVYLCTNAQLLEKRIQEFTPSPYLSFNVHLDGLKERHDLMVCKDGAFDKAILAIRLLVSKGFRVTTNTTFFGGETPENAARFLDFLSSLGVEGMTVAPGFSYEEAADQDAFLDRARAVALFRGILAKAREHKWKFNHSSLYLDFLAGNQAYACTPWGNPTYNLFGWQKPCYLIEDGHAGSYRQLMEETDWNRYGPGRDPRCADCMVHCGYEPTAVVDAVTSPLKALRVSLRGPGR